MPFQGKISRGKKNATKPAMSRSASFRWPFRMLSYYYHILINNSSIVLDLFVKQLPIDIARETSLSPTVRHKE
ncbi:uncharacterized protein TrAFT101_000657 [Trichoderma asperellum]|uniref:uncharacterized protein n=1 Tax=Trichoderma asperellum TaxID=101201 RepID=UPI003319F740|nr:hypothetical protein TrAFT101_000657 [Trichoderma asperellum]